MLAQLESDRKQALRRLKRYLTLVTLGVAYLSIDYSILRISQSGGFLIGGLAMHPPQPLLLFKYIQDESGERLELLDASTAYLPIYSTDELHDQIFVYQYVYRPIWAPIKILYPSVRFRSGSNRQLPNNLIQLATTATKDRPAISTDYIQEILLESKHDITILYSGILRNCLAISAFVVFYVTLMLAGFNLILVRNLAVAIRSCHCNCGYPHAGLTSPTCPECGCPIAVLAAQPPTTLDA